MQKNIFNCPQIQDQRFLFVLSPNFGHPIIYAIGHQSTGITLTFRRRRASPSAITCIAETRKVLVVSQ